jgi:hypothetical protein
MTDLSVERKAKQVIFSRGGGGGGRHAAEDPRRSGRHSRDEHDGSGREEFENPVEQPVRPMRRERTTETPRRQPATAASAGPYDITDAPADQVRVDLGSLQIPSIEGVEVRVQATEGVIQQVVLVHGASALQLGVFAAPRSEGIWAEVREEIRKSLFEDGVAAQESIGEYGPELRARVRSADGLMDLRFIGIDGPRWMLRAVYQGAAAADPSAAGPLGVCLRGLVVDRGRDAMPVREALPLRLPREIAEAAAEQAQQQAAAQQQAQPAQAVSDARYDAASSGIPASMDGSGTVYGRPLNGGGLNGNPMTGAGAPGGGINGFGSNGYGSNTPSSNGSNGSAAGIGSRGPTHEPDDGATPRRRPSPRPRRSE